MKRVFFRAFAVAAVSVLTALPSYSEDLWFDAGIKDYTKWPPDECPGTWSGTSAAELVGEEGARRLLVSSSPSSSGLSFAADSVLEVGSDVVTIRTAAKMSVFNAADEMNVSPAEAKCAIAAVPEETGAAVYIGVAKDAAGGTNTWVRLGGAVPDKDATVLIGFDVKVEGGVGMVRYSVDGTVLTDEAGNEWLESVFAGGTSDTASTVTYRGDGEVASLCGYTEKAIPLVGLTIPAAEHMSVASVKVGGVPVEAEDGVYHVQQGAVVSVRFAPDAGWALSTTTVKIKVGDGDLEFPSAEFPSAISVGSKIRINEIMAKNGSSLTTKNGTTDIDWVELYNSSDDDINLAGWYMGNDPAKPMPIEGECIVPAKGYKIVWFDGDKLCTSWAADEAHVGAKISTTAGKHTVFLSPTENAADIIQQIKMPGMMKDVSYGIGHLERNLLGTRDAAQYRVGEGEWVDVRGPIGMSAESSTDVGFTVTSYKLGRQITSVDVALTAIRDQAWKSGTQPQAETGVKTIAYRSNNQSVSFPTTYYSNFPVATEDLAVVVKGTVVIPESGLWTFSVGSDDGFRLTLGNEANSYSMEYAGTRGYGQTCSAFNMDAGAYNLELVYFDRNGGAALDLSVARGDFTTVEAGEFNTNVFHLLGTEECPVLFGGALAGFIVTDVKEEMLGKAQTLDWKTTFAVPADELPTEADMVQLKVRYADGLVAKLNGTEIARKEATARTAAETLVYATFEIAPALVGAENTLEITVTNDRIDDSELYLEAQITMQKAEDDFVYFRESTPLAANTTHGYGPMTPEVGFSARHGYKTEPFELTLSCAEAPYSPIYYTLDGTSPTEYSTLYTGPIVISNTTCIRAAVPQDNTILQYDCAATYIFLDDVLTQPQNVVPEGFPADRSVNNHAMRYGVNQSVVNGDDRDRLIRGFSSIATFSIVVDPKNLFDKSTGIYVNPSGDGRSWERQMMLEQINPNGDAGFSVPAGIRIRGAASRSNNYAKHSLRFFFRGEYGMGSLKYPLFGDEGADEFDKVDLRTSQNYSWSNESSDQDTFIHECFSRDSQGAMGEHYTRSRYYNLFINGQYWGLYMTQERGDTDFAESYNGGAADNYDLIKTSKTNGGYVTGVNEGTMDAWDALRNLAIEGFDGEHESNYFKAMGLNPDGSRNKEYPVLLNPTNLMVYIISAHYACDGDSPNSVWGGFPNNLYALRDRNDAENPRHDGFFFLRHDAEHSLGLKSGYAANYSQYNNDPTEYGVTGKMDFGHFNPAELHFRLCKNPDYRRTFADVFYKHCLKVGGAMTAPIARARFEKRMAEIDDAIVGECARWSTDVKNRNREKWLNVCNNNCIAGFIEKRMPEMLIQYRARGWYPSVDAAKAVNDLGGPIADGTRFGEDDRLYLMGGEQGKVYYTTDGSDPRLADGTLAAGAIEYTGGLPVPVDVKAFNKGAVWKYFDAGSMPASDWMAADYDDSAWKSGNGRLGFAGSGTFGTKLNRYVGGGSSGTQVTTFYFRKKFELPENAAEITALKVSLDCDDGYILYINGVEVKRDQVGSADYDAFTTATNMGEKDIELAVGAGLLKAGVNVIAVEVHQCNAMSTDAWWDCSLSYPVAGGEATGIAVPAEGMTLTMRVLSAQGEWSAIDSISVKGSTPMAKPTDALRVAAVMSSAPGGDTDDFLVLTNVSEGAVSLEGVKLVAWNQKKKSEADPSLVITFGADRELAPGEALTLTAADFGTDQKLTNSDVGIRLYDVSGDAPVLFQDVFVGADWFGGICDGGGAYFIAKEFGAEVKDVSQWRPSETWVARNLRFYEIEGVPAEGDDGAGEYFVLSNLSETAELDLTGVKIFIGKKSDIEDSGDSAAKCKLTLAGGSVASHSTLKFKQPDYGWNKITNSDLILKIYDAEGALVQYSEIAQKSFPDYMAGQKALRATSFERETGTGDWTEVDLPQSGSKIEGDGFLFYLTGDFTEPAVIAPTGDTCCVVLDGATVPGLTLQGAGAFTILASNANQVASLSASAATVTVEGDGALRFEGANTLVSVSNLTVKSGTFAVKSTGVSATKTPVVNVLGSVYQTGGTIDVDLDVETDLQIYGIYVANKDMEAEFSGGTFAAKVGGTKSAAVYGNKGSVDPTFSGDIAVSAVLTGPEARLVNADGNVKLKGGVYDVTMLADCASLTNARVFKATKDIKISGGTFTVEVPAAGSEIFSSDRVIDVSGGVLSLKAADDCFSATGDITISGGIVHALSTAGDAIDSNGSVTISGGKVFAFTLSADHDAIDVDPMATEESSVEHNITILDGATVVAVGGDQEHFHGPNEGSTATIYAEKGLMTSKKYVELTGVLAGDNAKTTTVFSVSWKDRHADTFTLIATMPGYDGQGYAETNDKPTDVYPNARKLNDDISGVFLREIVEELAPRDWPADPDTEITDETKPSDLCITEGAFAVATTDELRRLSKWAKANDVVFGGTAVNAMAFDADGNPATMFEEAYLLNCAMTEDAVAKARSEFKFNTIIPGVQPEIVGDFNGTVTVFGTAALGPETDWTPDNPNAHFYKAVLTR